MVADRIKSLREQNNKTQSELAKQLGITRSSVNAWEMGISVPSTQYIVELANIFHVSTDYLLGINTSASISAAMVNLPHFSFTFYSNSFSILSLRLLILQDNIFALPHYWHAPFDYIINELVYLVPQVLFRMYALSSGI